MDFGLMIGFCFVFDVGWFRCFVVDLVQFWFTGFGDMFGMEFYVFSWICVMRNVGKENLWVVCSSFLWSGVMFL